MFKMFFKSWHNQSFSTGKPSLTRKTLIDMSLRVAGVVLVSAGISFVHVMSNLETQTKQQLKEYITERGQRESSIFLLAQDNLTFLQNRLLQELKQSPKNDSTVEFDRLYLPWNDGTRRNFPQNRPAKLFDTARYPTVWMGRNVLPTPELQQRLLTAHKLISAYGPAWSNRFPSTYFDAPENANVVYWKYAPWGLEAKSDLYMPGEEYFYVADPKHNPEKKLAWTGVYLDTTVNIWMVSAIMPIYVREATPKEYQSRFLGSVGHDIVLTELMERTIKNQLPGTYNLIVRADGRLIVHPLLLKEIHKAEGKLIIEQTNDPHLKHIFQLIKDAKKEATVIDNTQDNEYLAITHLKEPDWFFVTVYPKFLLLGDAFNTAKFVLLAGAIALLIEVLLLYSVLQQKVAAPLQQLIQASHQLSQGNFDIHIDTTRQDELGQLADSFTSMASQLNNSFTELEQANAELENRVSKRTSELQTTLQELKHTQIQMLQNEKMSSLGQMVAGVAHEINNPVNFIHGNLMHVEEYTNNMLKLVHLYQQEYPYLSPTLEAKIEEIELEFMQQDLPKILSSMKLGTDRIRQIVLSLRNFSRLDEAEMKEVDIHEGIDSTLIILGNRLKASVDQPAIELIKKYSNLPKVECYAGQLNQVFMNILANAIDALEDVNAKRTDVEIKANPSQIVIETSLINSQWVQIAIADNGTGIPLSVQQQIFDPFFTTKPVGKGTGMGMSISYQIITEKHGGKLECLSNEGKGTKLIIEIPIRQLV